MRLFGEFELRGNDGAPYAVESARGASLLAYLLLHRRREHSRQQLAFLLWSDSIEAQARTNLRHVVHNLRQELPLLDELVEITPRAMRWRPDAACWSDVVEFESMLDAAESLSGDEKLSAVTEAVAAYSGDLLAAATTTGCSPSASGCSGGSSTHSASPAPLPTAAVTTGLL